MLKTFSKNLTIQLMYFVNFDSFSKPLPELWQELVPLSLKGPKR